RGLKRVPDSNSFHADVVKRAVLDQIVADNGINIGRNAICRRPSVQARDELQARAGGLRDNAGIESNVLRILKRYRRADVGFQFIRYMPEWRERVIVVLKCQSAERHVLQI